MKKMYVVVSADNVSTDVETSDIYTDIKAARKALHTKYRDILNSFDKDEVKENNKAPNSFSILVSGNDYFYANIKELKFAEAAA